MEGGEVGALLVGDIEKVGVVVELSWMVHYF